MNFNIKFQIYATNLKNKNKKKPLIISCYEVKRVVAIFNDADVRRNN